MNPDFELCDATYCRLEQAGEEPTDELYVTIVMTWSAGGGIGNGGFEYLFEGAFFQRDPRYERTLAAYERIGAASCAAAFREALGWLGSPPPSDRVERLRRLERVPEVERTRVAKAFWAAQPELERQLAQFIRAHAVELDARGASEDRLGDLRLRHPRKLEQVVGETVSRSFDLAEWSAEAGEGRAFGLAAALAAVSVALGAVAAARGWWWLAASVVAAILAVRAARPRAWLILRRGDEQVQLGGWDAVDDQVFSFIAQVVKATHVGVSVEDDVEGS